MSHKYKCLCLGLWWFPQIVSKWKLRLCLQVSWMCNSLVTKTYIYKFPNRRFWKLLWIVFFFILSFFSEDQKIKFKYLKKNPHNFFSELFYGNYLQVLYFIIFLELVIVCHDYHCVLLSWHIILRLMSIREDTQDWPVVVWSLNIPLIVFSKI